jgi:hypothetical protein
MNYLKLYYHAHNAGMAAGIALSVEPATLVSERPDGARTEYVLSDGLCGFAWITFAGNTGWGRWTKNNGLARKAYEGGYRMSVREFGQSADRKEAYARAFATVLQLAGITAYAQSRLD